MEVQARLEVSNSMRSELSSWRIRSKWRRQSLVVDEQPDLSRSASGPLDDSKTCVPRKSFDMNSASRSEALKAFILKYSKFPLTLTVKIS